MLMLLRSPRRSRTVRTGVSLREYRSGDRNAQAIRLAVIRLAAAPRRALPRRVFPKQRMPSSTRCAPSRGGDRPGLRRTRRAQAGPAQAADLSPAVRPRPDRGVVRSCGGRFGTNEATAQPPETLPSCRAPDQPLAAVGPPWPIFARQRVPHDVCMTSGDVRRSGRTRGQPKPVATAPRQAIGVTLRPSPPQHQKAIPKESPDLEVLAEAPATRPEHNGNFWLCKTTDFGGTSSIVSPTRRRVPTGSLDTGSPRSVGL